MVSSQDEAGDILRAGFAWGFPGFCPGTVHAWGKGEMGEEDAHAGGEVLEESVDKGGRDACGMGMGGGGGRVSDAEGFEVVVGEEVEGEAEHGGGDIAREAGSLAVVVGEVFADFAIDVVGGEEWVGGGAGEFRPDGPMDDAGGGGLGVPEREGGEDFGVEGVFIGDEDEGVVQARGSDAEGGE